MFQLSFDMLKLRNVTHIALAVHRPSRRLRRGTTLPVDVPASWGADPQLVADCS